MKRLLAILCLCVLVVHGADVVVNVGDFSGVLDPMITPIRFMDSGRCARATTGHAAAPSPAMKSRRFISILVVVDLRFAVGQLENSRYGRKRLRVQFVDERLDGAGDIDTNAPVLSAGGLLARSRSTNQLRRGLEL